MIPAMAQRRVLYWKRGTDSPDSYSDALHVLGPAWVIEADGSERPLNDGDWISKAEAERLAAVGGFVLDAEAQGRN